MKHLPSDRIGREIMKNAKRDDEGGRIFNLPGIHKWQLHDQPLCIAAYAYADGAKMERKRCLAIIERWRPMTKDSWVSVSNEIDDGVI